MEIIINSKEYFDHKELDVCKNFIHFENNKSVEDKSYEKIKNTHGTVIAINDPNTNFLIKNVLGKDWYMSLQGQIKELDDKNDNIYYIITKIVDIFDNKIKYTPKHIGDAIFDFFEQYKNNKFRFIMANKNDIYVYASLQNTYYYEDKNGCIIGINNIKNVKKRTGFLYFLNGELIERSQFENVVYKNK